MAVEVPPGEVFGWYDYEGFYDRAIATAPPGSTLVEIGVFLGKSLISIARKAKASGKNLRVIGVDTFQGSPEFDEKVFINDEPWSIANAPGFLAAQCHANLYRAGVLDDVTLIVSDSVRAASLFNSGVLHSVFVDADHSDESVTADIQAWFPKVASGGMIGGHDYWTFTGVKAAVDRVFPDAVTHPERTWWEVSVP